MKLQHKFTLSDRQHSLPHPVAVWQPQRQDTLKMTILGCLVLLVGFTVPGATAKADILSEPTNKAKVLAAYSQLPLSFEANQGQTDEQVKFLARGSGYSMFFTPTEAVLALRQPNTDQGNATNYKTTVVRLQLVNSNPHAQVKGIKQLPGASNYLIGNDSSKWKTNIARYAKVQYKSVYPGIDLVYYGNQRQLEYDFVVAPGANPHKIQFKVTGANKLKIDKQGNLVIDTPNGGISQTKPTIYQKINGQKKTIAGEYVLLGQQEVSFKIADYDHNQQLVIDPVVGYSTYFGGTNSDSGLAIAVDRFSNAYVTGFTASFDFPRVNPIDNFLSGASDSFVTKLNTAEFGQPSLVYCTYLGGSRDDYGAGIAVDTVGNAYVRGQTNSTNFPITNNGFDTSLTGANDSFVVKLNATGSALLYSTYLGGSRSENGRGIAVDGFGYAYVTGQTRSNNFPTKNAFDVSFNGGIEAFITKLNPAATSRSSSLIYSTYLGGSFNDYGRAIAVDSASNVYVTGQTFSTNFPTTTNAFDRSANNGSDIFVTRLNAAGNRLLYSTYIGGSNAESGTGIAVDSFGNAYVVGTTGSTNFPTKNPYDSFLGGTQDAVVIKFNPGTSGNASLVYSTYLGGNGIDYGRAIAISSSRNAYVTGETSSSDFPRRLAFDSSFSGASDAYVTQLNPAAIGDASLIYSSYLGGTNSEISFGIAVDSLGNAYVTGLTNSTNFPARNDLDPTFNGIQDAFITKILP